MPLSDIYHVFTNGFRTGAMFLDEDDFIAGMNLMALCSLDTEVKILCFCLMDNHVHFILKGDGKCCRDFIRRYRRRYSVLHKCKYPGMAFEDMQVGIKAIDTEEYLQIALAYVLRNPVAAGYPYLPSSYRWSSAGLYMKEPRCMLEGLQYLAASEYRVHELRALLKTHQNIPGDWIILGGRLIWPGSYVDYVYVNKVFGHPRRYMYYMSSTQEASVADIVGVTEDVFMPEHELRRKALDMTVEMFGTESLSDLKVADRLVLARCLKRKYGASYRQIARLVHLDSQYLKGI